MRAIILHILIVETYKNMDNTKMANWDDIINNRITMARARNSVLHTEMQ